MLLFGMTHIGSISPGHDWKRIKITGLALSFVFFVQALHKGSREPILDVDRALKAAISATEQKASFLL